MSLKAFANMLLYEAVMSLLLGAIPVFIASLATHVSILNNAIDTLLPKGFGMWYLVGLSVVSIAYTILVRTFPPNDKPGPVSRALTSLYKELRVVFRIAAGVLIAFSIVWAYDDYATVDWRLGWFVLLGVLALVEVTFFSMWAEKLDNYKGVGP